MYQKNVSKTDKSMTPSEYVESILTGNSLDTTGWKPKSKQVHKDKTKYTRKEKHKDAI